MSYDSPLQLSSRVDRQLIICNSMMNVITRKEVLKRIVAVINLRGVPFRRENETIGSVKNGNLKLLSKFDSFWDDDIKKYGNSGKSNPSYISDTICEECIEVMASKDLATIVTEILVHQLRDLCSLFIFVDILQMCSNIDIRNNVSFFHKLENCSVVEGSVQILLIDTAGSKDFENISFPKLQEITGYLILYRVQGIQSLSKLFPNLAVIRGDVLFHNYAFVLYEMFSLLDIGLVNLTTILRGSVRIEKNPHLCYVDTIDWDILAKSGHGGHFIKKNKQHEECPDTCPDTNCPTSSKSKPPRLQKLCWNSHTCQKVCSVDCEYKNLTCSSKHHCCHPECLGGCNGPLSRECIACRHVIYNGKCMKSCPLGTYKYLGRRCIEEEECKKIKNRLSISTDIEEIIWKPFQGECLPSCPPGYSVNESNKHQCYKCEGRCPKSKAYLKYSNYCFSI
ncbi:insulin-like peptide receptor [Stegodyphus dumicola]|uniref:insulin-like peptide receptor n=1 Tax=Stegodyphus dumicola TaxID=202533 RepID=UPI0015AD0F9D|nr:insulin-like peptide receptor [Stegodyphus dumicola]